MRDVFLSAVVSNLVLAGLLAGLAFLASRISRNPHLVHAAWLLVLIKLLTPPIFLMEIPWQRRPEQSRDETAALSPNDALPPASDRIEPATAEPALAESIEVESVETEAKPLRPPNSETPSNGIAAANDSSANREERETQTASSAESFGWLHAAGLLWGLGSLVCGGWVVLRCSRFRRVLSVTDPADLQIADEADRLSKKLGLPRCPSVFLTDIPIPPLVWGVFGRPKILIPRKLFGRLTPGQRRTVLVHELAHIRRRDHWLRWIEVGALVAFWWYPIAWWAGREMRRAEEECCDAWVVWALPESRQCYGQVLCRTLEFLEDTCFRLPRAVGGTMGGRTLKRRIEMIINQKVNPRMTWRSRIAIVLVAAIALPVAAQSPTQKPAEADEKTKKKTETEPAEPAATLPENEAEFPPPQPESAPANETAKGQDENAHEPAGKTNSARARLKPSVDVRIASQHAGKIKMVHVSEGDKVKKGQVLAEIKNTEIEIQHQDVQGELTVQKENAKSAQVAVRQAESARSSAESESERLTELHKKSKVVTTREVQKAKYKLQQAKLNLEKARQDAKTAAVRLSVMEKRAALAGKLAEELVIKAPADGIVLELAGKVGELVKANDAVARIVSLSPLVAESHTADPRGLLGKTIEVRVWLSENEFKTFSAEVTFVSPFADPVTGQFRIRCEFDNTGPGGEPLVRPGHRAWVKLPVE